MTSWENWSGRIRAEPSAIETVREEAEIVQIMRRAADRRERVRVVGAAHSHAPLVPTDGILLDPAGLAGVVATDPVGGWARIRAGTRIADLGRPLRDAGLSLVNQGDIDRQAIAGAIATGTHGTGRALKNLSSSLLGARLVLGDGEVMECSRNRERELFEIVRLHLGAVGVLTELTLRVRPAYRLEEKLWLEDLDAVLERIEGLVAETRHFEFFWMPGGQRAACKSLAETTAEPVYPLAEEGKRLAWSYEVLANDRPEKHSEMEYSVPRESGPDCLRALREMLTRKFPDLAWPVEYRTLDADDIWISTAYQRPSVTISVHQGIDQPEEELFRACERIFLEYSGRPHWGKVHYRSGEDFAQVYRKWKDWWEVRDRWDPDDRFINPHLDSLRPPRA